MDALDEAMAERVVTDVPGTRERLRFGHALIRDSLYDDAEPRPAAALHEQAAAALEAVHANDLDPHLAELAHHLFAADPSAVAPKAVEYARRAGDRAVAQAAYEEAVRLYAMALTLVAEDEARCRLLLALGDAQARAGDTPASKQSFLDAADLADDLGLTEPSHASRPRIRRAVGLGGVAGRRPPPGHPGPRAGRGRRGGQHCAGACAGPASPAVRCARSAALPSGGAR